jgi:hypothetical protein
LKEKYENTGMVRIPRISSEEEDADTNTKLMPRQKLTKKIDELEKKFDSDLNNTNKNKKQKK